MITLERGIALAEFKTRLQRVPRVGELQRAFHVSRATAYRYVALLGKPAYAPAPVVSAQAAAPAADHSPAIAALMQEFGFDEAKASEILAYERGEGAPA